MRKKIISALLVLAFAVSLFTISPSAEDDVTHLSAEINKNGQYVQLTGTFSSADVAAYKDINLSLFAVAPGEKLGEQPALEKNIKARKNVSLQTSLSEFLRYAFVLAYENDAGEYTAATNYAYISNAGIIAPNTYEQPEAKSKKGLHISLFADAQLLGVSHATITVPINEYILTTAKDSVTYRSGGSAYYFDKNKMALLDHTVKIYSDAGVRVYLQLVLSKQEENQPEYLYFGGADAEADYYAINTYSKQACDALFAFVSYLTERYTSPERTGFCGSFILGSEVNSNRYKNNAGQMSLTVYTDVYAKALRIVDAAARSVYSNARVYVSVANNLNKPSFDSNADPMLDFSVLDFLSHLTDNISNGGNIPWRLSVDPYNIDKNKADFKGAEGSEYSYDAKYVTMDNINILTSLLSQPAYLCNGERRPIIIGEISYPSGSNSSDEQRAQAAAYCLAYYKAEANEQIEAIIYGCHVDDTAVPGNFGLYTKAQGTENTPAEQKSVYRVFRYIDTDYSSVITEPYLSYYGLISWGEAVSGYNQSQTVHRRIISGSAATELPDGAKTALTRMTDFSGAQLSFYPSENAHLITTVNDKEAQQKYGSEYSLTAELVTAPPTEYRGVSSSVDFDLTGVEYAALDMKLDMGEKTGIADLMLRFYGEDESGAEAVYEGIAAVTLGQYYRLYFDVSEYRTVCSKIKRVSVWVKPHKDSENGNYNMLINGISFTGADGGKSGGSVAKTIIIVVIVVVVLAAAAYGIMYLRAYINYRKKKKRIEEKRKKLKK